jgi:hypothetical protein
MKQGTFEKEIFIKADAQTVIAAISDYSNHHKIHPLIVNVERAKAEPAGVRRYFITDTVRWGPFKLKIRYRADIISLTADTLHTEAHPSYGVTLTNLTRVLPSENGVRLHETITIKAPNILFGKTFKEANAAHTEMLKRIKAFIETNR